MNLSDESYIEQRVLERGILMATVEVEIERQTLSASTPEGAAHLSPVTDAFEATFEQLLSLLRPALVAPQTAAELDISIDRLLSNDRLFDLFGELSRALPPADDVAEDVDEDEPFQFLTGLDQVVGVFCVERVTLLVREGQKAMLACLLYRLAKEKGAPRTPARFPGQTLLRPSLYMGSRHLAPEVQRALLGRDIAQVVLTGIILARIWDLPKTRVLELCERFNSNQSLWLEFLNVLPGVTVPDAALPPPDSRVDFIASTKRTREAMEKLDRAVEYLDKAGETFYHFVNRDVDDSGPNRE